MQFDNRFPLSVKVYSKKGGNNMLINCLPPINQIFFFS